MLLTPSSKVGDPQRAVTIDTGQNGSALLAYSPCRRNGKNAKTQACLDHKPGQKLKIFEVCKRSRRPWIANFGIK
jgi:hypothetical protein